MTYRFSGRFFPQIFSEESQFAWYSGREILKEPMRRGTWIIIRNRRPTFPSYHRQTQNFSKEEIKRK